MNLTLCKRAGVLEAWQPDVNVLTWHLQSNHKYCVGEGRRQLAKGRSWSSDGSVKRYILVSGEIFWIEASLTFIHDVVDREFVAASFATTFSDGTVWMNLATW